MITSTFSSLIVTMVTKVTKVTRVTKQITTWVSFCRQLTSSLPIGICHLSALADKYDRGHPVSHTVSATILEGERNGFYT